MPQKRKRDTEEEDIKPKNQQQEDVLLEDEIDDDDDEEEEENEEQQMDENNKETKLVLHPILDYLKKWKYDNENWKLKVVMEKKLIRNFDKTTLIPQKYFKILLEYIVSMRGNRRRRMFDSATMKIEKEKEEIRKEIIEFMKLKQGESFNRRKVNITQKQIDEKMKESVKARRACTIREILVLSDEIVKREKKDGNDL